MHQDQEAREGGANGYVARGGGQGGRVLHPRAKPDTLTLILREHFRDMGSGVAVLSRTQPLQPPTRKAPAPKQVERPSHADTWRHWYISILLFMCGTSPHELPKSSANSSKSWPSIVGMAGLDTVFSEAPGH